MTKVQSMTRISTSIKLACFALLTLFTLSVVAQNADTANLRGTVKDPSGAVVRNASLTLLDPSRNVSRTAQTNEDGEYLFANVPPGTYSLSVTAQSYVKKTAHIRLPVGETVTLPMELAASGGESTVDVTASAAIVDTQKSAVSNVINQKQIDDLPINTRDYIDFAKTISTVGRDNGRPIGPAPTSGLNIGGQRGRSTLVQVDGGDNTDTSVNAARSTVSQEAVQEFQVVTNSYSAEFGRAAGGVVNVVTKSGTNNLHGSVFGFLRNRKFQANNPFAPVKDAPFTRTQYGASLGGPIVKDKTWFFASFEQRRRQETGFFTTDVTQGLGGSFTFPAIPGINPAPVTFTNLTANQVAFIGALVASGVPANLCGARAYAYFASAGGNTGLGGGTGLPSPNFVGNACPAISPILPGAIGPRFLLSGAPVPSGTVNVAGLPIAFRPLSTLQKQFPVKEGTTFTSLRLDHQFNANHTLTVRGGFNPSLITGIQVESQNQALGQNDVSRTGIQQFRDTSLLAGLKSILSNTMVNEFNYNWGRRSAQFRSQNGDAVAVNIGGTAFFGRELFSPVHRVENRSQFRDSLSWNVGHHLIKFGGDMNITKIDATFELNFAGLFNFGGLSASTLLGQAFAAAPDFTPVQQYGLGFPANYIQGFGNPKSALSNYPMSVFIQDQWQVTPSLTLNLGVRYDNELSQQIPAIAFKDPLSGINLTADNLTAAQDAMKVQQGFPRDNNNFAPRAAFAWDPMANGKTVVRGAYGIFYDHPLLAVGFNSDIADAAQQQQLVSTPGSPASTALLNSTQIFQGTVCVQGATTLTPVCAAQAPGTFTPGVAAGSQYQFGRMRFNDQTFPGFGTVLPFTLPVTKDFVFAYANQASFGVEHKFRDDMAVSVGWLFVGARHLPRPIDVNAPQNNLLIQNFENLTGGVPPANSTQALAFSFPVAPACATPVSTNCFRIPGIVYVSAAGKVVVQPAVANFFRPSGPNYFLASALTGGLVSKAVLDAAMTGSLRTPGVVSPFGSIDAQSSSGTADYHALNVEIRKSFSRNLQFLTSYTWSHSIDDSSDLQTLLLPQDNRNLRAERADSLFDQRHRFVFNGVLSAPDSWRASKVWYQWLMQDFTTSMIFEMSSGRPFNILSNQDTNNDQSNQTDRPNVGPGGVLVRPPDFDTTCGCFPAGNLGRNKGITTYFQQTDIRVMRAVRIGERLNLNLIAEGFNLLNHFNEASVTPFFTDVNAWNRTDRNRYFSRPTAAFDPRQFQFGLKLTF
jgi:hypothetical protein